MLAVQSGVAAGLAWWIAKDLLHHPRPFFAPVAAVIVLSASVGQRWRRAAELVVGVALGIGVADLLILLIGVGVIQIAVMVGLAIAVAIFVGGGTVAVSQAAASAVLVSTLTPMYGIQHFDRFVDALIGGTVGIIVMALLLPFNPLTRVQRAAGHALDLLADALRTTAQALRDGNPEQARQALATMRATEPDHAALHESLVMGRETAYLAPIRWRTRGALTRYVDAAVHVERATRNARVLAWRVGSMLRDGEPVPADLAPALETLAEAVRTLREELARSEEPVRARAPALDAVRAAGAAYHAGVGFSGSVVVAQVRTVVVDLLRATGLSESRADRLVRRAARPARAATGG
jgi:uncharacterized membrane protein YgaE (UPF0421/DUF939 family)